MITYQSYPDAAQAAYSRLNEPAQSAEQDRSVASLPGDFAKKILSRGAFWYYQPRMRSGRLSYLYIGQDEAATPELLA